MFVAEGVLSAFLETSYFQRESVDKNPLWLVRDCAVPLVAIGGVSVITVKFFFYVSGSYVFCVGASS